MLNFVFYYKNNRLLGKSLLIEVLVQFERRVVPTSQQKHPHQKPKELIKALIEATTQEKDLIVDPCADSFVVLEICQELNKNYLEVDLTFKETKNFLKENQRKVCETHESS